MIFKAYIANKSLSENEIKLAKTALYAYKFPVTSAVFNMNGELLNTLNTNSLLAESQKQAKSENFVPKPYTLNYLKFLNDAIEKNLQKY